MQTVIAELVDPEETIGCSKLGGIYSFVDDMNIFCGARIANRIAVTVRTAFKTCRLILSPTKCKFLVRPDKVLPDEGLNQFGVERNGIVIMGNPIGTERYRREQVFKITRAATIVIPALMKLLPWAVFSLPRHCVSTRAG